MYAVLLILYICDVPAKKFFLSVLGHRCEVNVAKVLYLDVQQTVFNYKMAYIYMRETN
jgi:hypothetical protein